MEIGELLLDDEHHSGNLAGIFEGNVVEDRIMIVLGGRAVLPPAAARRT